MAEKPFALQTLSERFADVRKRIETAAKSRDRLPEDITLVAISKTHPTETVRAAIATGITDLGENRVQEAEGKILKLGRQAARWHLVEHLQTNKEQRTVTILL